METLQIKEASEDITKVSKLAALDDSLALCKGVDLREKTLFELQDGLSNGTFTCQELLKYYTNRIENMNPILHAVIELNPDSEEIADEMDKLRKNGKIIGPLHGIPILLKDNIGTCDKMETTAGSLALVGLKPKQDSEVVKRLRQSGAIIIGKANLSEFSNFRGTNLENGWSGRGGQTMNAYVSTVDPYGSSTGSAVAVGTNLVPVALGSETDGSIVQPAAKACTVGLKTTYGRICTDGVIPLSTSHDVIGPIAKTVADAAIVFHVISNDGLQPGYFDLKNGFLDCSGKDFRVGVLRKPNWEEKIVLEQIPVFEKVLTILTTKGVTVVDPIVPGEGTLGIVSRDSEMCIFLHEFKNGLNEYLKNSVNPCDDNCVRNLAEVIDFNEKHPTSEGFDQLMLTESNGVDGIESKSYKAEKKKNQVGAELYGDYLFTKYSINAVLIPTESECTSIPAAAGYPHITIPAGFGSNGSPFGLSLYGPKNSEESLLSIANVIETELAARKPSKFL